MVHGLCDHRKIKQWPEEPQERMLPTWIRKMVLDKKDGFEENLGINLLGAKKYCFPIERLFRE